MNSAPAVGHDHAHFGALVQESANQLGALVGGNAAAHAENDAFPIQPLHRPAFFDQWICTRRRHLPRPNRRAKEGATIAQGLKSEQPQHRQRDSYEYQGLAGGRAAAGEVAGSEGPRA